MADMKFNCPRCEQPISCDELWSGHGIECPTCQANITVPPIQDAAASAPAPTAAPAPIPTPSSLVPKPSAQPVARLSIGKPQHPSASPGAAPSGRPGALPPGKRPLPGAAQKKKGIPRWAKLGAVAALILGAAAVSYPFIRDWQEKLNAKRKQTEKSSDGGEMGHIANLYDVLDATDPDKHRGASRASVPSSRQTTAPQAVPVPNTPIGGGASAAAAENAPVVPPAYTLEVDSAKVPEGKVNGSLSGTNFLPETIRLDVIGPSQVLRFTQGQPTSPDREILIYLHLKPGEKIAGHTWSISKDMKGADVPLIMKRWKVNPKYAPSSKSLSTGYAMKLELGQIAEGAIAGKIFVALPDTEQSVAGGVFKAQTTLTDAGVPAATAAAAAAPSAAPVGTMSAAEKAAFEKRYGIKR